MCAKIILSGEHFVAALPHVQTRACHSAFNFAPHCCMQHSTLRKISHRRVLYWQHTIRMHSYSIISHGWRTLSIYQPASQYRLAFWHLIFWVAHVLAFIHLVFLDAKDAESGQHALTVYTLYRSNIKIPTTYLKKCIQFVHTQRNCQQYAFDALRAHTIVFTWSLTRSIVFFRACFFLHKFMCIEQIVYGFWCAWIYLFMYMTGMTWSNSIRINRNKIQNQTGQFSGFWLYFQFEFIANLDANVWRFHISSIRMCIRHGQFQFTT